MYNLFHSPYKWLGQRIVNHPEYTYTGNWTNLRISTEVIYNWNSQYLLYDPILYAPPMMHLDHPGLGGFSRIITTGQYIDFYKDYWLMHAMFKTRDTSNLWNFLMDYRIETRFHLYGAYYPRTYSYDVMRHYAWLYLEDTNNLLNYFSYSEPYEPYVWYFIGQLSKGRAGMAKYRLVWNWYRWQEEVHKRGTLSIPDPYFQDELISKYPYDSGWPWHLFSIFEKYYSGRSAEIEGGNAMPIESYMLAHQYYHHTIGYWGGLQKRIEFFKLFKFEIDQSNYRCTGQLPIFYSEEEFYDNIILFHSKNALSSYLMDVGSNFSYYKHDSNKLYPLFNSLQNYETVNPYYLYKYWICSPMWKLPDQLFFQDKIIVVLSFILFWFFIHFMYISFRDYLTTNFSMSNPYDKIRLYFSQQKFYRTDFEIASSRLLRIELIIYVFLGFCIFIKLFLQPLLYLLFYIYPFHTFDSRYFILTLLVFILYFIFFRKFIYLVGFFDFQPFNFIKKIEDFCFVTFNAFMHLFRLSLDDIIKYNRFGNYSKNAHLKYKYIPEITFKPFSDLKLLDKNFEFMNLELNNIYLSRYSNIFLFEKNEICQNHLILVRLISAGYFKDSKYLRLFSYRSGLENFHISNLNDPKFRVKYFSLFLSKDKFFFRYSPGNSLKDFADKKRN